MMLLREILSVVMLMPESFSLSAAMITLWRVTILERMSQEQLHCLTLVLQQHRTKQLFTLLVQITH